MIFIMRAVEPVLFLMWLRVMMMMVLCWQDVGIYIRRHKFLAEQLVVGMLRLVYRLEDGHGGLVRRLCFLTGRQTLQRFKYA